MSEFTPSQLAAIQAPGNVLVVAGAGTGKTRTLVERCLRLVLQEGASLENVLMVTFTEAAAAEMRDRIRRALLEKEQAALADEQAARSLAQQIALLDTAYICTLHSFCLGLLRQHFHLLGLDPQVAVLDEAQTRPLAEQTLDALLASCYASASPAAEAVRSLVRSQDSSEYVLRRLLLRIHQYTQSLADPAQWLADQMSFFERTEPDAWRRQWREGFQEWRQLWRPALETTAREAENVGRMLQAMDAAGERPTGPAMARALQQVMAEDATGQWPKNEKGRLRQPIRKFFEEAAFLLSLAAGPDDDDPLVKDWQWVKKSMLSLLRLTREFGERFARAKRDLGGVDFADIEQLSLRLLWDRETGDPSPVALEWRQRLRHLFVDEFQDINGAQEAILRALGREGEEGNRFLVGDVKQSIYRFRLANPRIFQEYARRWRAGDRAGRCLPLADNFRSHEGILQFVNSLFAALMRPGMGGVAYDEEAQLRFGEVPERAPLRCSCDTAEAAARVELHLFSSQEEDDGEGGGADQESAGARAEVLDLQTTEREARLVGSRLKELKENRHPVWDDEAKQFRPAEWRDMVVLLRSARNRVDSYAKEFSHLGVPLLAERGGFYGATEILDLLSLLRVLDNPLQDVPLLAVLRSPLVGLSLAELAAIRVETENVLYWAALKRWHREQTPRLGETASGEAASLWSKVDTFLAQVRGWRRLARERSLSECLEAVLRATHYEALLQAGDLGGQRLANVQRLLGLARRFDPWQRQGLFRFLRYVEAQEETGLEEEPAPLPTQDAVRLMTMHKSKGLEFPVVVLAGLGTPFNLRDLQDRILLSEDYGLAPKVQPPGMEFYYPSITHWLASRRARRESLGEELRLLYVAMTRARDSLILVGSSRSKEAGRPWLAGTGEPISDQALIQASTPLDWLRLWLPGITKEGDWQSPGAGGNKLLRWAVYSKDDPRFAARAGPEVTAFGPAPVAEVSAERMRELRDRLEWAYPWPRATIEPAKATVSALRRRALAEDESVLLELAGPWRRPDDVARKKARNGLSAVDRGSAHHLYLELLNLDAAGSELSLKNEALRLVRTGLMTEPEAAALDFERLLEFWQTDLGRSIRAQPRECVHREMPFTVRLSFADLALAGIRRVGAGLPVDLEPEFLVVQGTVDLAVILPAEIWLLDFKTDRVKTNEAAERAQLYRPQLTLYGLALERVYRRPVRRRHLYFLEPGVACQI